MLQLSEGSLPVSMLLLLALALLELASLSLPWSTLPAPLRPASRVRLPTHRAGRLPGGRWKLTTDIQNAKESDPDTRRSPWYSHARPTRQRPWRSREPWIGNSLAGSGQVVDRREGQTHPVPEAAPPAAAAFLSRPFRWLL